MFKCRFIIPLIFFPFASFADERLQQCVMQQYQNAAKETTLGEIQRICENKKTEVKSESEGDKSEEIERPTEQVKLNVGAISNRKFREERTQFDPYVITPHKLNYILPAYTTNQINKDAYSTFDGYQENLEDIESKFQISLKVPLNNEDIFLSGDALYVGFTLQAWWQVYADNISKPFRESNYQPEVFYFAPLDWQPFEGNTAFILGIEHESNGRSQDLSRSWNRLYSHFLYEKNNFAFSFRPWVRLSEDEKEFPFDPDGDDNPDIEDFMGHFELGLVYSWENFELSFLGRQNFSTNNGSAQLGLTFPLWGKLRGYATAFNGYGESLIDYNHRQTRLGLGIALNNIL